MLLALAAAPAHAETLIVQGSTTFNAELITGRQTTIETAARHTLKIIPNKSNLGLIALMKGEAHLAMISATLASQVELLRRSNPELSLDRLQFAPIARTTAAIVLHRTNPLQDIAPEDLRRALTGEITNWRELGGADLPIRIVTVRDGGGVLASVEAAILGTGRHITAPNQIRVPNGPQILNVVEQEPGALGVTQSKLVEGRAVQRLRTAAPIEQHLSIVSLGDPTPAMRGVIAAFKEAAHAAGLD